jgi:TatA/E family protein of Tat protein translocase
VDGEADIVWHGAQELLVILVIVLVLFGGSELPDLAKSLDDA